MFSTACVCTQGVYIPAPRSLLWDMPGSKSLLRVICLVHPKSYTPGKVHLVVATEAGGKHPTGMHSFCLGC